MPDAVWSFEGKLLRKGYYIDPKKKKVPMCFKMRPDQKAWLHSHELLKPQAKHIEIALDEYMKKFRQGEVEEMKIKADLNKTTKQLARELNDIVYELLCRGSASSAELIELYDFLKILRKKVNKDNKKKIKRKPGPKKKK